MHVLLDKVSVKVIPTAILDLLVLEPRVIGEECVNVVQDNHNRPAKTVLRGLHDQIEQPQGKLVRVSAGAVFDAAVDLRAGSPFFGR